MSMQHKAPYIDCRLITTDTRFMSWRNCGIDIKICIKWTNPFKIQKGLF